MQWHLDIDVPESPEKIDYSQGIVSIGSCFAEYMGRRLQDYQFKSLINPHGILFNPFSISKCIRSYLHRQYLNEEQLVQNHELWCSLDHHGDYAGTNPEAVLDRINSHIQLAHDALLGADWLLITFGSAHAYKHLASGKIVANCHKIPQKEFNKILLAANYLINDFHQLVTELHRYNNRLKIVFSVSPVKYLRDGVVENNLSKAVLLQTVHALVKESEHCYYFPAFELVNDDLRDYRFYKEDLAHPNAMAIDYVWNKFKTAYFNNPSQDLMARLDELQRSAQHRPLKPGTAAHQAFKANCLEKCLQLEKEFPFLDLEGYRKNFES